MRWSKLKQIIEGGFAPPVADRVHITVTRYRKAHDAEGRWALLIDGKEVGAVGCIVADREQSDLINELAVELNVAPSDAQERGDTMLRSRAHHTLPMFMEALFQFTRMSIDAALESSDAVLRTLAVLDPRTGKRRLMELAQREPPTDLERQCLLLRLRAAGFEPGWGK